VATFAGYVPAENPEISMVIVVDEPQGAFYASAVAAPVFSQVGHYALRILGVPPDGSVPAPNAKVRAEPAAEPEDITGGEDPTESAQPLSEPTSTEFAARALPDEAESVESEPPSPLAGASVAADGSSRSGTADG